MTQKESIRSKKIINELKARGHVAYKIKGSKDQENGIPDILASINGIFCGIEVKRNDNKPSILQTYNLKKIARDGGIAFVITLKESKGEFVYVEDVSSTGNIVLVDKCAWQNLWYLDVACIIAGWIIESKVSRLALLCKTNCYLEGKR